MAAKLTAVPNPRWRYITVPIKPAIDLRTAEQKRKRAKGKAP